MNSVLSSGRAWIVLVVLFVITFLVGIVGLNPLGVPFIPDAIYTDALIAHWGAADFMRESVLRGEYPLWRETIFAGVPFAANPLNKTAYPPQWLATLLPPSIHLNTLIVLHLMVAGAGMWAWARRLRLRAEPAALAVLAYVLAPRVVATLGAGHLDIIYALAWVPWLAWLLTDPPQRALLWLLQVALVAALLFLADVRVALFGFLFCGAYALWRVAQVRDARRIALAGAAILPFALLVVALLVPLLSWQPHLSRADITVDEAGTLSLEPFGLAGLLLPPHEGGGGFETMVYLTLPVLVLALVGLFARPPGEMLFWGGVIFVAALWALGVNTPFWRTLAQSEVLRWFRVPARAWLVVVWSAPILAGYGLQAVMHITEQWRAEDPPAYVFWLRLGAAGAGGLLAVCGGTLLATGLVGLPPSAGALLIFNGLALGSVLLLVLLQHGRERVVALSLLAITFADAAVTGANWLEWRGANLWLAPHAELADALLAEDADRVYSPAYALPQEVAEAYNLRLFYGVDPFQLLTFVQAVQAGSGVPVDDYSIVLPPPMGAESDEDLLFANQDASLDADVLAAWGVSHVIAAYPLEDEALALLDIINGVNVYRNTSYTPEYTPPELLPPATITRLHRLTLLSAGVSAVAWVVVGGLIAFLSIQVQRRVHPLD